MDSASLVQRVSTSLRLVAFAVVLAAPIAPLPSGLGGVLAGLGGGLGGGFVSEAAAQGGREIVGGPVTTTRFERLARLYVAPTTQEMTALDRLHERYLEKFRAEIDPEIAALADEGSQGFPTRDRFEKLMRDMDRINARIAEADSALFAAATEAVAEARRPGVARMKSARERQRLLSGVARFVPMSFGHGAAFVDLADILARDKYTKAVPAEAREQFDAFLASQEPRLLAQARNLNTAAREGMNRMFDLSAMAMQDTAPNIPAGATPEQEAEARAEAGRRAGERMRSMAAAMEEIGRPIRKILRSNHADNRIACGQLAPILGRAAADELRELVATRALGGEAYSFGMSMDDNLQLASVARRMKRDGQVAEDARARIDELVARWHGQRAGALEAFMTVSDDNDGTSSAFGAEDGAQESPQQAAINAAREQARERLERADGELKDALLAMLGGGFGRYFEKVDPEEGEEGQTEYFVKTDEPTPEEAADIAAQTGVGQGIEFGYLQPIEKGEVLAALKVAGATAAADLVDATYDTWLDAKWQAKVGALNEAYRGAQDQSYQYEDNGVKYNAAMFARMADLARSTVAAVCDADEALASDLGGALGIAADSPAVALLRLASVRRLSEADGVGEAGEMDPQTPSVARMLALADATPAEVARILGDSKDAWASLVAQVRPVFAQVAEIEEKQSALSMQLSPNDRASARQFTDRYEAMARERAKLLGGVREKLLSTFDEACARAVEDPERRDAFRRARTRAVFPALYSIEQSAEVPLTAALSLRDIDEDLRAKVEALRAEYIAVFDKLSDRMIEIAAKANDRTQDDWAEYTRQMQLVDGLRFERDERTAKAIGELRRLLGPERASRIPSLAEREKEDDISPEPSGDED